MQEFLKSKYPEVHVEVPIPGSSINGNTGFADIVYTRGTTVEIYEIKPISYYYPSFKTEIDYSMIKKTPIGWYKGISLNPKDGRIPNNISGKGQLQRYIENYPAKPYENVKAGTSLNLVISEFTAESDIHKDKIIVYYTYPNDPGMVYWSYRKNPKDEKEPAESTVPSMQLEKNEVTEFVENTSITGILVILGYEVLKWGLLLYWHQGQWEAVWWGQGAYHRR